MSIVFLDELTSTLDHGRIQHIQRCGIPLRTVVCTIHQPRSNVVVMFDHLDHTERLFTLANFRKCCIFVSGSSVSRTVPEGPKPLTQQMVRANYQDKGCYYDLVGRGSPGLCRRLSSGRGKMHVRFTRVFLRSAMGITAQLPFFMCQTSFVQSCQDSGNC